MCLLYQPREVEVLEFDMTLTITYADWMLNDHPHDAFQEHNGQMRFIYTYITTFIFGGNDL